MADDTVHDRMLRRIDDGVLRLVSSGDLARWDGEVVRVYCAVLGLLDLHTGATPPAAQIAEVTLLPLKDVCMALTTLTRLGYLPVGKAEP